MSEWRSGTFQSAGLEVGTQVEIRKGFPIYPNGVYTVVMYLSCPSVDVNENRRTSNIDYRNGNSCIWRVVYNRSGRLKGIAKFLKEKGL